MACKNRSALALVITPVLFLLCALSAGGEEVTSIEALSARASALGGGTSAAYGGGLDAIYLNPTALAGGSFSLTALESSLWVRSEPAGSVGLLERAFSLGGRQETLTDQALAADLERGVGLGGAVGLGATGGGFGLGLRASADSFSSGALPGKNSTRIEAEIGFVGGVALPFELGPFTLTPALDVRPFVRIHAQADGENSASVLARFIGLNGRVPYDRFRSSLPVLNGYGFAINSGLRLSYGSLFLAGVVRDLGGTPLQYSRDSAGTVLDSLALFGLPAPAGSSESGYIEPGTYVVPMRVSAAIGFQHALGKRSDLLAYAELGNVRALGGISGESTLQETGNALLDELHAGAELGLGRLLAVRAGFDRGRPGVGLGLELGFWELDAAYSGASLPGSDGRRAVPLISVTSRIAF